MIRFLNLRPFVAAVVLLTHVQCSFSQSQQSVVTPDRLVAFKEIDEVDLKLHVFEPDTSNRTGAAIIFFFGGGWVGGSPAQFYPQCQLLSSHGMLAISAEYRVRNRHQTTPFECVKDGKSAVRWVRTHAEELQIDPKRIVASGGSAGGHVAVCTAVIEGMDDDHGEELAAVSSIPNALVLFNPVIDTSKRGFGYKQLAERYREISPIEHVRGNLPPTLILQGLADTTTPPSGHREFERRMTMHNNVCRLVMYPHEQHGFFNLGRGDNSGYQETTREMIAFLKSHGFLSKVPTP